MARVSFRLRKTEGGGALRSGDAISSEDEVDGLRADSVQVAPSGDDLVTADEVFFEARSTCYGEISLEWSLPLEDTIGATPVAVEYVVAYSPFGPPETIPSGSVVAEGNDSFSFIHTGLPEGDFAYYTLFVRYRSTLGDDYYERVAQLSEIVPRNFGSTIDMWNRIPEFHRLRDAEMGTIPSSAKAACLGFDNYGDKVGPLLSFLSIFGFEMDRVRSLAAHVARAKDPQHTDTESLAMIAHEVGALIGISDLGGQRLRSLLNSIGVYRRIKGTQQGTEYALKALTGNNTTVDDAARTVTVDSGRVNYILDPQNTKSVVDIETKRAADDTEADNPDTWELGDVPPSPSASAQVYRLTSPVTVTEGDVLSFSVHSGSGVAGNLAWARTSVNGTGAIVDTQTSVTSRYGVPYFDIRVSTTGTVNIEFMVRDDSSFGNSLYLLEKNSQGQYFDGSLVRGGWLIDSTSISDYRWEGAAHNSVSLYSEDYERTKQLSTSLYPDVLPVHIADLFSISFNNLP